MTSQEFDVLIRDNLDKIYRVARRYTSDSAAAEDLVSSALLSAFKHKHQCDGRFPLAWFLKVMRNQHLMNLRQRKPEFKENSELETVVDARAHDFIVNRIEQLDILEALQRLPEEYRLVVALCDMEELDYSEAAAALDIPVGTVRSRLSRGRRQLQSLLASWSAL